jgi:hypothetical protein
MPHLPDTQHPDHDLELVAAYAAGDASGPDLELASALVSTCAECSALHHDLRAIAAAMPELPAPARPRDFRLTPEQAASLRPSGIRGMLATLSGPRFAFATPLGTGLAALGIVGALVASGGLPSSGGATSVEPSTTRATAPEVTSDLSDAQPGANAAGAQPAQESAAASSAAGEKPAPESAAASSAPAELAPAPSDATLKVAAGQAAEPTPPASGTGAYAGPDAAVTSDVASTSGADPRLPLAVAVVFVGAALVAARLVARRLARAP